MQALTLLKKLILTGLLENVYRVNTYYDEPHHYYFSAWPERTFKLKKHTVTFDFDNFISNGISFKNSEEALLKCLVEFVERFSIFTYSTNQLLLASSQEIIERNSLSLDLNLYPNVKNVFKRKFHWINGYDYLNQNKIMIPAQLVFLNLLETKKEFQLTNIISTGTGAGIDKAMAANHGLLEVVERDCFMTSYLLSYARAKIKLETSKNMQIKKIILNLKRYRLDPYVFDITNDLEIPTYLSIIVDRTGIGPVVSLGLKSNFSCHAAILGSLSEAMITRPRLRYEAAQKKYQFKKLSITQTLFQRGLYWYSLDRLDNLNFYLKKSPQQSYPDKELNLSNEDSFQKALKILSQKKMHIYGLNLINPVTKATRVQVVKIIIPELQPLFLNENWREIRANRIKSVADYFNLKKYKINLIPHPFL